MERRGIEWADGLDESVVNLDGSDPLTTPKAVPQLIVHRVQGDIWETRCALRTGDVPSMMHPFWSSRDAAKGGILLFALNHLTDHGETLTALLSRLPGWWWQAVAVEDFEKQTGKVLGYSSQVLPDRNQAEASGQSCHWGRAFYLFLHGPGGATERLGPVPAPERSRPTGPS